MGCGSSQSASIDRNNYRNTYTDPDTMTSTLTYDRGEPEGKESKEINASDVFENQDDIDDASATYSCSDSCSKDEMDETFNAFTVASASKHKQ
ncbi:hypothetical protein SNE40_000715 [Patella caerulea]|uniref:Uncharacterized protein n=1 Tax=Patella caerulea TaxID=87958 RepID=A0AAN8KEF3_PATCE